MKISDLSFVCSEIRWKTISSNITAKMGYGYLLDVSTAAYTITLPSNPSVGNTVVISDLKKNSGTNNITVSPNGKKIRGSTNNYLIKENGDCVQFVYTNDSYGWQITSKLKVPDAPFGPDTFYYSYGYGYANDGSGKGNHNDCYSYDGSWTTETSGPSPNRYQCGGASVKPYAYTIGGYDSSYLSDCDAYNGSSWYSMASMSSANRLFGAASLDDRIYVINGHNGSGLQTAVSSDGAAWYSAGTNSGSARWKNAAFSLSKIYTVCGYDGSNNIGDCDSYDGTSWSSENSATARRYLAGSEDGNYGYATGGYTSTEVGTHEQFDGSTWTAKTSLGYTVRAVEGARYRSSIVVAGGFRGTSTLNDFQEFDGSTWTAHTAMTQRRNDGAGSSL